MTDNPTHFQVVLEGSRKDESGMCFVFQADTYLLPEGWRPAQVEQLLRSNGFQRKDHP